MPAITYRLISPPDELLPERRALLDLLREGGDDFRRLLLFPRECEDELRERVLVRDEFLLLVLESDFGELLREREDDFLLPLDLRRVDDLVSPAFARCLFTIRAATSSSRPG